LQDWIEKPRSSFVSEEFAKASQDFLQATCAAPDNHGAYYAPVATARPAVALLASISHARQALQEAIGFGPTMRCRSPCS